MNIRNSALTFAIVFAASAAALVACSEDSSSSSSSGNPFSPPSTNDSGVPSSSGNVGDAGPTADGGGCSNKPAGCFCGKPTTQQQFLNRCTTATALPVNLTVKPASTTNIP